MDIYSRFIQNFMRAKSAIDIAKQSRPMFAKFLEVSTCVALYVYPPYRVNTYQCSTNRQMDSC